MTAPVPAGQIPADATNAVCWADGKCRHDTHPGVLVTDLLRGEGPEVHIRELLSLENPAGVVLGERRRWRRW